MSFINFILKSIKVSFHLFLKSRNKSRSTEDKIHEGIILKHYFEKLGGAYLKFGQFLSLRFDVLPREYCNELFDLLDKIPGFSKEDEDKIFIEDFGTIPQNIFKSFDYKPFASASIGQVHIAYTNNDEKVAVKILRPNIKQKFEKDLKVLKRISKILDISHIVNFGLYELILEFEKWLMIEIDFIKEAENTKLIGENKTRWNPFFHYKKETYVPKVYSDYSSKQILTTQFIEGTTFSEIIRKIKSKEGFELSVKVIHDLSSEMNKQCFVNGFFHGDPHPGNIILGNDGRIYWIDCSLIGRLTLKERLKILKYIRLLSEKSYEEAFDAFIELAAFINPKIITKFRNEFLLKVQEGEMYEDKVRQYSKDLTLLLKLANNYRVRLHQNLSLFLKANAVQGSVISILFGNERNIYDENRKDDNTALNLTSAVIYLNVSKDRKSLKENFNTLINHMVNSLEDVFIKNI